MSRRNPMTKAKRAEFLEHMRQGMRRGAAANAMGLERKLVLDFILDNEEFEKLVLDAEGQASEHVEEALYQAAVSGSVPACKLWLDLRKPKTSTALVTLPDSGDEGDDDLEALMNLTGARTGADA